MAVDARQELDLRIGVAFTRLLTRKFLDNAKLKFPRSDLKVLSYGPCQTPTLWFCVQRHVEIQNFRVQRYWAPKITVDVGVPVRNLDFILQGEGKTFDERHAKWIM